MGVQSNFLVLKKFKLFDKGSISVLFSGAFGTPWVYLIIIKEHRLYLYFVFDEIITFTI